MTTRPRGVKQIIDLPNGGQTTRPVLSANWHFFCTQAEADSLFNTLKQTFPSFVWQPMVEDGEEMSRYIFSETSTVKIFLIQGTDDKGNMIGECPGDILTRMTIPESVDQGRPYLRTNTLKMNWLQTNGIAEFYWSK